MAELVREHAIVALRQDAVHVGSLFEGFMDDAITSIGRLGSGIPTAVTPYDLIPLMNPERYLDYHVYRDYYLRKIESLKRADLLALFDPISPSSIADAMNRALADEAFSEALRAHGLRQARKFSWEATARRALAAFEMMVETESGRNTARATLGEDLAVSAFPLYVPV